ncbi:MAG: aminotransferase class IV, partial [Pseudomonadota bacterium]
PDLDLDALIDRLLPYLDAKAEDGRRTQYDVRPSQYAVIYLQITRGPANRGHPYPPRPNPTVYAHIKPITWRHGSPIRLLPMEDQRGPLSHLKTLNLLPNVMAAQQAQAAGFDEALLIRDGAVREGSHTSIFGVRADALLTHPLDPHILPGVTRGLILDLARGLGISIIETAIEAKLGGIEELFAVGTTTGIAPITAVGEHTLQAPGPITKRLITGFAKYLANAQ